MGDGPLRVPFPQKDTGGCVSPPIAGFGSSLSPHGVLFGVPQPLTPPTPYLWGPEHPRVEFFPHFPPIQAHTAAFCEVYLRRGSGPKRPGGGSTFVFCPGPLGSSCRNGADSGGRQQGPTPPMGLLR